VHVWRGFTARIAGFYEVFWLSFSGAPAAMKSTDGGVSDTYWGAIGSAGYLF
jgi:hypothetical protein